MSDVLAIYQYLFAHEAQLQNELISAEFNYNCFKDPLSCYELLVAIQRVEDFKEVSAVIAGFLNSQYNDTK